MQLNYWIPHISLSFTYCIQIYSSLLVRTDLQKNYKMKMILIIYTSLNKHFNQLTRKRKHLFPQRASMCICSAHYCEYEGTNVLICATFSIPALLPHNQSLVLGSVSHFCLIYLICSGCKFLFNLVLST